MKSEAFSRQDGLVSGRLSDADYRENFGDIHPPLGAAQAVIEAERCYYCHDAPCVEACPTRINIPSFIHRIAEGNLSGAARKILEANILGGMCARVCPTENLCEGACVRMTHEEQPVKIGLLQRRAVDHVMERGERLFSRGAGIGGRVAIVGGGPAGLACAHRLAELGRVPVILERHEKVGGLDEYGIAAYKVPDQFARREAEYVLSIGGIEVRTGRALGRDFSLSDLRAEYDAVFLGLGLGAVNALGLENEGELEGVMNAVDFIEGVRQAESLADVPVGRRVVVIGGGMTAVDAAAQARRLGAEESTIAYRRGPDEMPASEKEMDFVRTGGSRVKFWASPRRLLAKDGRVAGVEFEYTEMRDGALRAAGDAFTLEADMVLKAIGQKLASPDLGEEGEMLAMSGGKIAVSEERKTSLDNVWAGGDCAAIGEDLTVWAVEDGKTAANAIHRALSAAKSNGKEKDNG